VLVTGAGGGVGSYAVQIAKALGADVTGVCSTPKVDLVRSLGADHVIDYTRDDFTRSGKRYDVIIDTAGIRGLNELRRALTPTGTLVLVGGEGGGRLLGGFGRDLLAPLLSPFVSQSLRPLIAAERREEDLAEVQALIESGNVRPVVDRTYQLSEVPEAIGYLHSGRARGKLVI
jgi:NADPH:quinone reductase-like Zn-dependent oxidoreductase